MIRSVAAIICALNSSAPAFPHKAEAAPLIRELAAENGHDPFTLIEVVEVESRWSPHAVNPRSGAVGLGQHLPKDDADRVALLDWRYNLRRTSIAFRAWRELCRDVVGTSLAKFWLQGYGGFDAVRKTRCGHRGVRGKWVAAPVPKYVKRVLAGRRELVRRCQ